MTIFNSLGSNYNFKFVLRSLFVQNRKDYSLRLIQYLEKKYGGEVFLTYKGREALRLAFRVIYSSKKVKPLIGICGFICYAVYEAVKIEGYDVVFFDISQDDINFSFDNLIASIEKGNEPGVIIVQNTLGFPCDMPRIGKYCKERGIILIEDLAHSVGARYEDGREAGTVADFTILSFSQDKMVDGVSGGALVIQNSEFRIKNFKIKYLPLEQQLRDRFYPLFTWIIRKTYVIGLGKAIHEVLKKLDLLSKPMEDLQNNKIYGLQGWYCDLIYKQFKELDKDLIHRKKIAAIYAKGLNKNILSSVLNEQISRASNLRFPIFITEKNRRDDLIAFLKKQGIFVSDIWYDAPIAPKKYLHLTDYKNQCPKSEKVSEQILNLPTHRNASEKEAEYIVEKVNQWLEKEAS